MDWAARSKGCKLGGLGRELNAATSCNCLVMYCVLARLLHAVGRLFAAGFVAWLLLEELLQGHAIAAWLQHESTSCWCFYTLLCFLATILGGCSHTHAHGAV